MRSADRAAGEGIAAIDLGRDAPWTEVVAALSGATHLLVSIPPGDSDPVLAHFGAAIRAAPHLAWIGYLSTVGVYGDYGGAWVSEAHDAPSAIGART